MKVISQLFRALSKRERNVFFVLVLVFMVSLGARGVIAVQENTEYVPVKGGEYREGILGQPTTVNPVYSGNTIDHDISALIFSKLGDLMETWNMNGEYTVFTVNLKEGLLWDDGTPLTSDDVVFTVQTIQDPKSNSTFFKNWQGVGIERVSELQVRIALPAPYVFFSENIKRLPVIPKHIFGTVPAENMLLSSYNLEPVGSGPFKFESLSQKKNGFISEYRLTANDLYHGEEPYLEEFSFRFFEDRESLIAGIREREVNGFGSLVPGESEIISSIPQTMTEYIRMPRTYSIFFNSNNNPVLKDKSVRLALSLSVPKERIVNEVLGEEARIADSPFGDIFGENSPLEYDPESAKTLLEESGEDVNLTLVVPDMPFLAETADMVREAWTDIGVSNVTIVLRKPGDILETVIKPNNYEVLIFGNVLEIPEDLFPFWHSSQRVYPGLNLAFYKNDQVDKLIESVRETGDPEKQKELIELVEAFILDDVPAVFLFSLPYTYTHSDSLGGFLGENDLIVSPSDRFKNVAGWYVKRARVFK